MANPEHMALVRKGAEAIAEWRRAHPDERLDLSGADLGHANLSGAQLWQADLSDAVLSDADLSRADLGGANLSKANLSRAYLSGANLSKAKLSRAVLIDASLIGADLWQADLSRANLSRANLFRAAPFDATLTGAILTQADLAWAIVQAADLKRANLTGVDLTAANLIGAVLTNATLTEADLEGANLTEADLGRAELTRAKLSYTSLADVDLSQVTGLATVNHEAPSSVGVDTLIASFRGAGNKLTPELTTFFLGAGVPKELLEALPEIVAGVEYYSCFISYGQPDVEFATKLCQDLEARGVSCWLYDMDKTPGKRTWAEIGEARRGTDKFVVLCSAAALVRPGVLKEIEEQIDEEPDKLVPISLDDLWTQPGFPVVRDGRDLKPFLMERNRPDFSGWDSDPSRYDKALEELLNALRRPAVKKPRRKKG